MSKEFKAKGSEAQARGLVFSVELKSDLNSTEFNQGIFKGTIIPSSMKCMFCQGQVVLYYLGLTAEYFINCFQIGK